MIRMRGLLSRSSLFVAFIAALAIVPAAVVSGCAGSKKRGAPAPVAKAPEGAPAEEGMAPVAPEPEAASQPPATGETEGGDAATGPDKLLGELALQEQARQREAAYTLEQANRYFNEADYRKARDLYKRVLDLNPRVKEAKERYTTCLMFLGQRDGEILSTMEQYADEIKVANQSRLAEAVRYIEEAKKARAAGEIEAALRQLTRAREQFLWYSYESVGDVSAYRSEAEDLFQQCLLQRATILQDAARGREDAARGEAERLRAEDEQRRKDRIGFLLQKVREHMGNKEFDLAAQIAQEVIELDPEHREAHNLLHKAKELGLALRKVRWFEDNMDSTTKVGIDLEEAVIPHDDPWTFGADRDYWRNVVAVREEGLTNLSLEETFEVQRIRQVLETSPADFDFIDESLANVVNTIRTIADLNIQVDPEIDAEQTKVNISLHNVKLRQALELILKHTGLAYTFKENVLFITGKEKAHGNTLFEIYNVTDILNKIRDFPGPQIRVKSNDEAEGGDTPFGFDEAEEEEADPLDPESLAALIKNSTGGDELWEEAKSEIIGHQGQLLVTATLELHRAVKAFLQNLRQDSDLFVIVEARFIDIFDDFLEDIGIDSRNLGQPIGTGFGTAYGILNSTSTGGSDPGFNNRGDPTNPLLTMGQKRTAGRIQHLLDGFIGAASGTRLDAALKGLTLQATWLDPFQINAILRATQETRVARTLTAPRVTASNGQRVHVSVITQRAYVQDYELVSGGTGLVVQEVADPVVSTFQEGVILDVQPVISSDRRYVTLDVRPTLASLINGVISTVTVSLGSLQQAATQVDIDLPEITLQQAFTSVTVPDGGTVLLGGFRSVNERKYVSSLPIIGDFPILKNLFRRKAYIDEKRSLYILLTAQVIDLRAEERKLNN